MNPPDGNQAPDGAVANGKTRFFNHFNYTHRHVRHRNPGLKFATYQEIIRLKEMGLGDQMVRLLKLPRLTERRNFH
jgi:hypothetical protein